MQRQVEIHVWHAFERSGSWSAGIEWEKCCLYGRVEDMSPWSPCNSIHPMPAEECSLHPRTPHCSYHLGPLGVHHQQIQQRARIWISFRRYPDLRLGLLGASLLYYYLESISQFQECSQQTMYYISVQQRHLRWFDIFRFTHNHTIITRVCLLWEICYFTHLISMPAGTSWVWAPWLSALFPVHVRVIQGKAWRYSAQAYKTCIYSYWERPPNFPGRSRQWEVKIYIHWTMVFVWSDFSVRNFI